MSEITIEIYGSISKLSGNAPIREIRLATSYAVEGAEWSPSYRKGLWDGRKHLFNKMTGAFPTGLLSIVLETCESLGRTVTVNDLRTQTEPLGGSFDLEGIRMEGKYAYQLDACKAMLEQKQGIVKMGTGAGKTEVASAVIKYIGRKTLFIVTNRELLYQARARFQKRLGLSDDEVGIVGDGIWSPGSLITVATVDTLEARINEQYCQDLVQSTEVLFIDEAHHVGSETWYTVATLCPAMYRFGLSGTPLDRTDGANLRLIAATGDIIVNVPTKFLVENDILAKADIIFDTVSSPTIPKKSKYPTVYKQGVVENEELLTKVIDWTKAFRELGLSTLILVEEISQGKLIDDMLWSNTDGMFIPHQFIYGEETTEVRQKALEDFGERRLPVLIASTILDEGVDVPTIDTMILAGSRKSKIRTLQRLGRGLRGDKLIVVEFANYTHKYLLEHTIQRLDDYRAEDCFGIFNSSVNKDLIQKLWDRQKGRKPV